MNRNSQFLSSLGVSVLLRAIVVCGTFVFSSGFAAATFPETPPEPDAEFSPVAIWTANEYYVDPNNAELFAPDKAIDGKPETYACILDSLRTGKRAETQPPFADEPITAEFVLDLGSERETVGLRFVSVDNWRALGVRNVSVFACDDSRGETNLRSLVENEELLPSNYGCSVAVLWNGSKSRYLSVKTNCSYQLRNRRQGLGTPETYFNTQIAEIRALTKIPDENLVKNPNDVAFPTARLRRDWIYQDFGLAEKANAAFCSTDSFAAEQTAVDSVLNEIEAADELAADDLRRAADFRAVEKNLIVEKTPGADERWKSLYFSACELRRTLRLRVLLESTRTIFYTKHFVFGGTEGLTGISHLTDEQYFDATTEKRPGAQLCALTFDNAGNARHEVLLEKPNGLIRDPNLSFDGKTLVFAMRDSFDSDDYRLYTMDVASRAVRQLTFAPKIDGREIPCADFEPCFAPNGDVIFASTRHVQINDCWPNANTNLFTCDADGKNVRRLTYDELDVNYPQPTNDGRIVYTRWEYNDRNAYFLHPLATMNPDGTGQTEFCGANSMFPASYLQARAIPNSSKLIAIIGGHHVPHKGKLALIDRSRGTQDGRCIEFVAGSAPDGTPGRQFSTIETTGFSDPKIDFFGQSGAQFQYPYPLDEENYLVAFSPEGWATIDGPFNPPFGVYWTSADGARELLAFDPSISCGQPIAVFPRDVPTIKPSQVDLNKNFGTFVVQDVYRGPGLAGVERGTVDKLRIVALEYRAAKVGNGRNAGEADRGIVQTPISLNNGSWDVKHVLGEVDVEADGSVAFQIPARTPVYFQLLDKKGFVVQTMRSWATLQSGERFACLGCHEDKLEAGEMIDAQLNSIAANKPPQIPRLFGGGTYPLIKRLETESAFDSIQNYLGVNAPPLDADPDAPTAGFSYRTEIQPILDRHCVACHSGTPNKPFQRAFAKRTDVEKTTQNTLVKDLAESDSGRSTDAIAEPGVLKNGAVVSASPDLRGYPVDMVALRESPDDDHKRAFTRSYLELTNCGKLAGSRWVRWLETRSRSEMLPPYHTGSSQSSIMSYFEPSHYGVDVSEAEKRTFACWIDLLIPFCGSYTDANRWTPDEKEEYLYYLKKRLDLADQERCEQEALRDAERP